MLNINLPAQQAKNDVLIAINNFDKMSNTLIDDARLDPAMAKESLNLIQVQDGRWKTRWGTEAYGTGISGESSIDGCGVYVTSAGARELIAIGGTTGAIFKSTDDGANWSQVGSVTLTTGKQAHFVQIRSFLYIGNKTDNIVRYNGTTATQYSSLSAPAWAGTPLARTGLTSGSYTYYYQVTALNEVGETVGSTEESIAVNKTRDEWNSSNYLTLDWDSVSGATRYQVYMSDETGNEVYLDSTTDTGYVDDGTATANPYVEVPSDNTTTAPTLGQMAISINRIWGIADDGAVWFGGTGQFTTYFSPFYGGGYVYLEKGGPETPIAVKHFRTGGGSGVTTVFTSEPSGKGSVWQITLESVTVESVTFIVPIPTKIISNAGANSALGVVNGGDDILMANKNGVFSVRNKPNILNVLSTDELSVPIRPSYRSLAANLHTYTAGIYFQSKFFFSVSRSSQNDTTIIYDTERNGWVYYWDIGAKQFIEYTDANEKVHFLAIPVTGNQLIEWSEDFGSDQGTAIRTSYVSGLIPINKDKRMFARINEVIFELGRPKGTINLEVLGIEKKKGFSQLGTKTVADTISSVNFTDNAKWGNYAWSDPQTVPSTFSQATVKKLIKLRKLVNYIQFRVSSTALGTDYAILSIQATGRITSRKAPTSWK